MSKLKVVVYFILLLSYCIISSSYSTGITGKAITGCGGNGCHTMDNNTSILLTGIPATGFIPDSTYTMTLSVINASKSGAGFDLKCDSGILIAGSGMVLNGIKELYHNAPQYFVNTAGIASWTFDWQAPSTANSVSFFVAGNSVNSNVTQSGDAFNTDAFYFDKDTTSPIAISKVDKIHIQIYPNPVKDYLIVDLKNHLINQSQIQVYDFQGRGISLEHKLTTPYSIEISTSQLPKGLYFLKINNSLKRFIKE